MIRVLHVHDRDADLQTDASLRALRAGTNGDVEHATRTIGRGGDYANLPWAVIGLRRVVDRVDVLHVWDERSLGAASLAGAKRLVFTMPAHVYGTNGGASKRDVALVCTTPAQHTACVTARTRADECHVIRPPLPQIPHDVSSREALRGELGFGQEDFVMLAPGESTRPAAHERAVWAGSILHVIDERYRVLLWGRGPRLDIAAGLGHKLRQLGLVSVAERVLRRSISFGELLPAADAMLVTATAAAPTLPVMMAMAADVPVVGCERPELADILFDNVTALTVPSCTPRLLAQRVLDLRADPGLVRSIVAAARARVAELLSSEDFSGQYLGLYRQLATRRPFSLSESAAALGLGA